MEEGDVAPARRARGLIPLLLAGCSGAPEGPPNIVLISIDTFRGDRLGVNGNPDGLTPNLDRLAAEGTTFTHAYSQATHTGPSHTSMFSSRYPTEVDTLVDGSPGIALAQVLRLYGYQTAARTAGGDLTPTVGPTQGFDSFESADHFSSLWHTAPMGIQWLDQADPDRPSFLFVHGYDTHTIYLKPEPFGLMHTGMPELDERQRMIAHSTEHVFDRRILHDLSVVTNNNRTAFRPRSPEGIASLAELIAKTEPNAPTLTDAEAELIGDLYDGAVRWADAQVGLLLAALDARGRLDNSVVVVIGDHGEALGEGGLFHRCCGMNDAVVHVPLVVRLPGGVDGGRRVDTVVELLDVMPTLLELAGATPPADIQGRSLVPFLHGGTVDVRPYAFSIAGSQWSIVSARNATGRFTYTGVPVGAPDIDEIIASASLPGPSFESTMPASEQAAARDAMVAWVQTIDHTETVEPTRSQDLKDALKAHGYWETK